VKRRALDFEDAEANARALCDEETADFRVRAEQDPPDPTPRQLAAFARILDGDE
jgi:hypothetical protein